MPDKRVLILSSHSLFAEGIASRLLELTQELEISSLDPRDGDPLGQIKAADPAVVILDTGDPEIDARCPITSLLALGHSMKIIRLDSQREELQVLTIRSYQAARVRDLYKIIMEHVA